MARPRKARKFKGLPKPVIYVPVGWVKGDAMPVEVAIEDFEIMRLVDGRGYHIQDAAEKVGVSRSTAGRMLERARRIVALGIEKRVPLSIDAGEDLLLEPYMGRDKRELSTDNGNLGRRVAVACQDTHLDTPVERIFGRSPAFVLVAEGGGSHVKLENPGFGVRRNAAGFAVAFLKKHEVTHVVAGRFGPEALELLAHNKMHVLVSGGINLGQTLDFIHNHGNSHEH